MNIYQLMELLRNVEEKTKEVVIWTGDDDTGEFVSVESLVDDEDWDRVVLWEKLQ